MKSDQEESKSVDVAIVGAGPAGRYLGALLARRGLKVAIVDPSLEKGWPNTYGVWVDEVEGLEIEVPLEKKWSRAAVYVGENPGDRPVKLDREYGLIDRGELRKRLDEIFAREGAIRIGEKVLELRPGATEVELCGEEGMVVKARVVIDASGGRAGLIGLEGDRRPGYQSAYGVVARVSGDPLEGEEMVLMDFRPPKGGELKDREPTFLYGMKLGEDRYFLEETVLVGREPRSFESLKADLQERLTRRGIEILEVEEEERCLIPMGIDLPLRGERILAFGASAGFVHPATGYQISRMFGAAAKVADRIEAGLEENLSPGELSREVWEVIWPEEVRRARQLLIFGQEVLLGMDGAKTGRFFEAFFELPEKDWRLYLSGVGEFREVASMMWRLFRAASISMRWSLARRAFGRRGRHILRAFLGEGEREAKSWKAAQEGLDVPAGG